jgi:vacuolar-type H+-ATPase subunit I/STV1
MRLPVPRHVIAASILMGLASIVLGYAYATSSVYRRPQLEARSVVAVIEQPLGWVLIVVGLWVMGAAIGRHTRASAHAVAAVVHAAYLAALCATFVLAYPLQSVAGIALALFPCVAHGGAAIEYWQRGYR